MSELIQRKPIIGIIGKAAPFVPIFDEKEYCHYWLRRMFVIDQMREAVVRNGGIPMSLLFCQGEEEFFHKKTEETREMSAVELTDMEKQINTCDGVILQGGLTWALYEVAVAKYAIEHKIPILGICSGMNNLIRAGAGTGEFSREINRELHNQANPTVIAHSINIEKDSMLYQVVGQSTYRVNSIHTKTIKGTGIFTPVAYSEDGLIEAIELQGSKYRDQFAIGIQWHPEFMAQDAAMNRIFQVLVEKARESDAYAQHLISEFIKVETSRFKKSCIAQTKDGDNSIKKTVMTIKMNDISRLFKDREGIITEWI